MAMNKKLLQQEPDEIEALLPWHAAGTLSARDARRVEEALARDPALARQFAAVREEYAETIALNESLGAPSARAMQKLFAAIDAEPAPKASPSRQFAAKMTEFFAGLSPRALAYAAALGALALLLQAGVIGAILTTQQGGFQTASFSGAGRDGGANVFVRFAPDARMSEIEAFLQANQASIVGSASGGMFRLRFGDKPMSRQDIASLVTRLQNEKIIQLAAPAQ
jgi:anti-sigma factor RsiW